MTENLLDNPNNSPLFIKSHVFKPFRYPFAYEAWLKQNQVIWLPDEVPLADDVKDWQHNVTPEEKNLLTQIFRFFTQNDVEVGGVYIDQYSKVYGPNEIRMMFTGFANVECVHQAAYAHLLDTVGMPEVEYSAFLKYKEMKDKFDYMQSFNVNTRRDLLKSMACFSAFTEGLQLFASFAMLMNFPRFNKMKGMGQIVTWSVRDETLHVNSMINLFRITVKENLDIWDDAMKAEIYEVCRQIVMHEDAFIDLAFELGGVEGMTPDEIKQYIRFIADRRLTQLGMKPQYNVEVNPLPWMDEILNAPEFANFFEQRSTEYSKAATTGTWKDAFEGMNPPDQWLIYGQQNCPQCVTAKNILSVKGAQFQYVDLTGAPSTKQEVYERTGARSMPMIFKNGKFFGSVFDLETEFKIR